MDRKEKLLYEELSYEINGCAFEAFKAAGVGFEEINYHKVFDYYLKQRGLKARYKAPFHLDYLENRICDFIIDEIVEDKIVIELKCIQTGFMPENIAQIITYLRLTNLRLGLLINFGLHQAFTKRIIFDAHQEDNSENWDMAFFQTLKTKKTIDAIIASVRNIDTVLGPGYHGEVYKRAFSIEMNKNKFSVSSNSVN